MSPRWSRLWTLPWLILAIQVAASQGLAPVRRADASLTPTSVATSTDGQFNTPTSVSDTPTSTITGNNGDSTAASNTTVPATPTPTVDNGNGTFFNSSILNSTIPDGELPIQPQVTPGWGVAGIVMLFTGAGYALIGIKNQFVHTFFSTAYLASLGTTVLIVYVMSLPLSDAIQGAYVVAVVLTGIVLGGAATIFKEITEGLGCLLGGFCLSMWLLCLTPGGLLSATGVKVAFIACFSLGGFGFYFSHYTRDYALIAMISFAGATITVLGIDCFSRAGLKEFWAYVWNLNDSLFLPGTVTYPVTKGIRVETAAIIIIFLAGFVSQLKLWRLIQARRARKAEERAAGRRHLDEEEENVGRQVEATATRERIAWERRWGDGDRHSTAGSGDSGIGSLERVNEKKLRSSNGMSTRAQSPAEQHIEMTSMSSRDLSPDVPPKSPPPGLMVSEEAKGGMITVRVAQDETAADAPGREDSGPEQGEKIWILGADGELRRATKAETKAVQRRSQATTAPPAPAVVPLPFKIPSVVEEQEQSVDYERSSVATFADEDGKSAVPKRRESLAKRLSQGSANLLRSLSQRSRGSIQDSRMSDSQEQLVIPRTRCRDDDDGSMAATIDDESLDGDHSTIRDDERPRSIALTATLSEKAAEVQESAPVTTNTESTSSRPVENIRPISTAGTVTTNALNPSNMGEESRAETAVPPSPTRTTETRTMPESLSDEESRNQSPEQTAKAKSEASVDSTPASLTKEKLPRALSRIAMSYRTNEWAKHLSLADAPEPDTLQIDDHLEEAAPANDEAPAPLNLEELQQTADTGTPAPAPSRSATTMSNYDAVKSVVRSTSRQSIDTELTTVNLQAGGYLDRVPSGTGLRRMTSGLQAMPITEEGDEQHSASTTPAPGDSSSSGRSLSASPVPSEPSYRPPVPGVISYTSPQTLIGQRDMLLRNRSNGSLPPGAEIYRPIPYASSSAGSVYDYPAYSGQVVPDDDMPMSQRRDLMRNMATTPSLPIRPPSGFAGPAVSADETSFNSHQPQRHSNLPTPAQREARLNSFRQSVQADLRAGTPIIPSGNGRETPLLGQLPGQYGPGVSGLGLNREGEVQRSIDMQRSMMLSQKEAEAQRREAERWEKERGDRAFQERMQRGELLEAHREAIRKMQAGVKGK